jgi:predicted kinase
VNLWLLIMCGYPFSGKSTLALLISETLELPVIAVDDLHVRHHNASDGEAITERDWLLAYKAAYRDTVRLLTEGESVIFDSVGYTRKDRDRLRRVANRQHAHPLVVWLDVSAADARRRLERNRIQRERANVPVANFEQIVGRFEDPTADEATVIYRSNDDPGEWINQTLRSAMKS